MSLAVAICHYLPCAVNIPLPVIGSKNLYLSAFFRKCGDLKHISASSGEQTETASLCPNQTDVSPYFLLNSVNLFKKSGKIKKENVTPEAELNCQMNLLGIQSMDRWTWKTCFPDFDFTLKLVLNSVLFFHRFLYPVVHKISPERIGIESKNFFTEFFFSHYNFFHLKQRLTKSGSSLVTLKMVLINIQNDGE